LAEVARFLHGNEDIDIKNAFKYWLEDRQQDIADADKDGKKIPKRIYHMVQIVKQLGLYEE